MYTYSSLALLNSVIFYYKNNIKSDIQEDHELADIQ